MLEQLEHQQPTNQFQNHQCTTKPSAFKQVAEDFAAHLPPVVLPDRHVRQNP